MFTGINQTRLKGANRMHPDTGFDDVFEMVAAEEGVSVEAVRAEIARAMQDAMNSSDPAVQAHWRSMKKAGETPTPEEMFCYLLRLMADA